MSADLLVTTLAASVAFLLDDANNSEALAAACSRPEPNRLRPRRASAIYPLLFIRVPDDRGSSTQPRLTNRLCNCSSMV